MLGRKTRKLRTIKLLCINLIMSRKPISTGPIDQYTFVKGTSATWFFVCLFFYLIGLAISESSAASIVISFFALILLVMLMSSLDTEIEIKTLIHNLKWYRYYSLLTLGGGALVSLVLPFDFASPFALLVLMLLMPNGMIIWPWVTFSTYKKNYTNLFGIYDA